MKTTVRVIKGLTVTAVLALSLLATSGSAAAKTDKWTSTTLQPVVDATGVTWDAGSYSVLGVTWE